MSSLQMTFKRERETKNTVRFSEVVEDYTQPGVIGTLYVQKTSAEYLGNPETLIVTVANSD